MMNSDLLDQLCAAYGMLPSYCDIWGEVHVTAEHTKRALLTAMGVAAEDDAAITRSLQYMTRRAWERLLPPVQVLRETARPYRIAMSIPAPIEGEVWRWRLIRETGSVTEANFVPASLKQAGRQHLDGQDFVRRILVLDLGLAPGYHRLTVEHGEALSGSMSLIISPNKCYVPGAIQGNGRAWGISAQLYGVRSERNWGMGDFSDLRGLIELCAEEHGSAVLLNPLHALFADMPEHASPYSPSSRVCLNILYLDVEAIADFADCNEAQNLVRSAPFQAQLRALRASEQVDYRGVAGAKLNVLAQLYEHFRAHHLLHETGRGRAFRAFQGKRGENLRMLALLETLQEHFRKQDDSIWGWPAWPEGYQDPQAPEVEAFCEAHLQRVEFFEYLQWQAFEQLEAAGTRSWELGLGVGIMQDLAVGVTEGGAATWSQRELYAFSASTGAPPDELNRIGQDWGLPPWIPHRLVDAGYQPFIDLLRTNMRAAGGLRLDHVMGLQRLFWVARGAPPTEGAYVTYPFDDLLGILALESQRNRCLVVGEDLGTVPDEVRHAMEQWGVMSTRLLYFEHSDDGGFRRPGDYPVQAMVSVTNHDLATLAGFWHGLDLELRDRLQLYPTEEVRNQQVIARAEERAKLLVALESEELLPAGSSLHPMAFTEMTPELAQAVYAYLASAPARMLMLPLEDGLAVLEQPNLPGTTDPTYPCWRRKLPLNLEAWRGSEYLNGILRVLRVQRPVERGIVPIGADTAEGVRLWIPCATYRLQLNCDFSLRRATELVAYLDELGVSHLYLSPFLKARPGSRHGYDITDHSSLNPEIASAEDFEQFVVALRQHGMGLIMDMVPNHMGIMGADNAWWLDVLENGPASRFAGYFDIDWYPLTQSIPGTVLLPVLGEHYGTALERGDLKLNFDAQRGEFSVVYFQHRFPIDPREYPRILGYGLERLQARLGAEDLVLFEFQSLVTAFSHLPARDDTAPQAIDERARDKQVHKQHLASLVTASADIARYIEENTAEFNGETGSAKRKDLLHELLQVQAYRLAYWRVATDEINYRRFFDINDLAALRMENPEVFSATHGLVRELLARGQVNGLRIDHPDGLYAPQEYFERLQAMAGALSPFGKSGANDSGSTVSPLYLVVEKILAAHEHLPENWPVHGTTGYDFAALCNGLYVNGDAEEKLTRIHSHFTRSRPILDVLLRHNKHLIMETALAGELQVLATQLTRIARESRDTCDFTLNSLRNALAEIVASFPVYRTYISSQGISADDARHIDWALSVAQKHSLVADPSVFDFVRDVFLNTQGLARGEAYQQSVISFVMKFQQYSSPVMAKAMEDTTFYAYNRLVSLNEVGSDPQRFGISPQSFHHVNQVRAKHWPHAMLASTTHDTKRSEDVRARINVLSELPNEWREAVSHWSKLNRSKRRRLDDGTAPSRSDEFLLYQTLLGIWPFEMPDDTEREQLRQRLEQYMIKAVREAKLNSSWVNPNADYESATLQFVDALLSDDPHNLFLRDFLPFRQRVARIGIWNSLSQLVLKLTAPGVPDIYQGNELWDYSLVDPDSRRPVDYERRLTALREVKEMHASIGAEACLRRLLEGAEDGRIKLYITWQTLQHRRRNEALFRDGDYQPLKVEGVNSEHLLAFARRLDGETAITIVPRLLGSLAGPVGEFAEQTDYWSEHWIELPDQVDSRQWTNIYTARESGSVLGPSGAILPLGDLLAPAPMAVLQAEG
ncbi:MAG: malto-oligosyltrehalose synthase [Thiobacillaceae bacterium]